MTFRAVRNPAARCAAVAAGVLLVALALLAPACSEKPEGDARGAPRFAATRSLAAGGLTVSLNISSLDISVADRLELLIEARQEGERPIVWPALLRDAQAGGPFPPEAEPAPASGAAPAAPPAPWTIVDLSRRTVAPGHELLVLVLEPYLPGDKPIPAFRFGERAAQLATEPITVRVSSVTSDPPTDPLAALADLGAALPPAADPTHWWAHRAVLWGVLAAAIVPIGAAIVAWLIVRMSRRTFRPDDRLHLALAPIRASLGRPDAQPAAALEAAIRAFRRWQHDRRIVPLGATAREAAEHVERIAAGPASIAATRLILQHESTRFGPVGVQPTEAMLRDLLDQITGAVREAAQREVHA